MQQRFLLLILALISSAGHAGGLPKRSAQAGQVRFTATLLENTVRIGEPLLVTCAVRNVTTDTQYMPIGSPRDLQSCGAVVYTVVNSQGLSFGLKPYALSTVGWISESCIPIPPRDSIYWHQLLPLDHYYSVVQGKAVQFEQTSGSYRLVTALLLPVFPAGDQFPSEDECLSLTDTAHFELTSDPKLSSFIRPYREAVSIGLWTRYVTVEDQELDRILKSLASRPTGADATYPYLEYLTPHALSVVKGGSPDAVAEGKHFIATYPDHPLSEEMTFDMWYFLGRLGRNSSQDSLAQVLLKTYPRNTRIGQLRRPPQ
jgi:hypothetical protein